LIEDFFTGAFFFAADFFFRTGFLWLALFFLRAGFFLAMGKVDQKPCRGNLCRWRVSEWTAAQMNLGCSQPDEDWRREWDSAESLFASRRKHCGKR